MADTDTRKQPVTTTINPAATTTTTKQGVSPSSPITSPTTTTETETETETVPPPPTTPPSSSTAGTDRRMSAEWDASKVPPSRFQKRKGSIYAVPGSRDGHVDGNYAAKFHEKHAEKGYDKMK